jgi:catechol 2,3-dioxygenase-like lactoylglutathione lyase family enzyme
MADDKTITPELAVTDRTAAASVLTTVFGFTPQGDRLTLGSQSIALIPAVTTPTHGRIDHLALAVNDVDATLATLVARGARLDSTTPGGPNEIPEFWADGVRYVFLQGPEGARIELCAKRAAAPRADLPGHDHIGIPCTDIAATAAFFASLGLVPLAAVTLTRDDGETHVRFLGHGAHVVELYEPPHLRGTTGTNPETALWHGLRLTGATGPKGALQGPDGLRVTLL